MEDEVGNRMIMSKWAAGGFEFNLIHRADNDDFQMSILTQNFQSNIIECSYWKLNK